MSIYERFAELLGRILLGSIFIAGAYLKIPGTTGFASQVAMAVAAHMPFPMLAVLAAFPVELLGGLAVIFGYRARVAAAILAVFTLALALIFHSNFADPEQVSEFSLHLTLIGGLLLLSVHGAKSFALRKD